MNLSGVVLVSEVDLSQMFRKLLLRELKKYPAGTPRLDFFTAVVREDIRCLNELGKDAAAKARLADMSFAGLGGLQVAALFGNLSVVHLLVERFGFPVDGITGDRGLTALCCAASSNRESFNTVNYLLEQHADPDKTNSLGQVPLHCAARMGNEKVAELLISKGANVDGNLSYYAGTPLHIAAFFGRPKVIDVLLKNGAMVNVIKFLGTPVTATLNAAVEVIKEPVALECLKLLVEEGNANVNPTEAVDQPLLIAATHGFDLCTAYLLDKHANPNVRHVCCCQALPIEVAARSGNTSNMMLLFPKTDPTAPVEKIEPWTVNGISSHVKSKNPKIPKHVAYAGLKRAILSDFHFVRMPDLPEPHIKFVVKEDDPEPLKSLVDELRLFLADHEHAGDLLEDILDFSVLKDLEARPLDKHPLLEGQTFGDPPTRWIHVSLKLAPSNDSIRLIVRADNVYVWGFVNERDGNIFCYELIEPEDGPVGRPHRRLFPFWYLAIPLHWDVKYKSLFKCDNKDLEEKMKAIDEDPTFVSRAIRRLSSFDHTIMSEDTECMEYLAGLIFKLCEYSRMQLRGRSRPFIDLVHNWRDICIKLIRWRDSGYTGWNEKTFKDINIKHVHDALEWICLVLNCGLNHVIEKAKINLKKISTKGGKDANTSGPGGDGPDGNKKPTKDKKGDESSKKGGKTMPLGHPRVQLLKITANFPVAQLNVYDLEGVQTIYISPCQSMVGKGLVLTGPRRPLSPFGVLAVEAYPDPNLLGYPILGELDPWECDPYGVLGPNDDDDDDEPKILEARVGGGFHRLIEITYLLIPNAIDLEFMISLSPVVGPAEHVQVSGTIRVYLDRRNHDFKGHRITLFASEDPYLCPTSGCPLDLSTSSICVPYRPHLELTMEVNLRIYYRGTVSNMVGYLRFMPRTGMTSKVTHGNKLQVLITANPNV